MRGVHLFWCVCVCVCVGFLRSKGDSALVVFSCKDLQSVKHAQGKLGWRVGNEEDIDANILLSAKGYWWLARTLNPKPCIIIKHYFPTILMFLVCV